MLIHLPIIILTSLHPTPIADAVPKFEIARECQFEGGLKEDLNRCVTDETQAREQLQTKWAQYASSEKKECNQVADTSGISSYVELQVCLEMERDVKQEEVGKMYVSAVERAGLGTLREGQKISYEIVADRRSGGRQCTVHGPKALLADSK